jgi:hypothetical protein
MTDYTKSTNFATKDTLPPGSALKIVRGTEIDTEFNNIATAVATKADSTALSAKADLASPALTGTPTAPTPSAGDNDTSIATTAFVSTAVGALGNTFGFKNRIINGAMVIDQRNAGASVTVPAATVTYTLDRYAAFGSEASKFTVQQNAASVTPPVGFTKYLGVTSSSAYTVGASEQFWIRQAVEGFNTADLAWGTANAATVTTSFWVRSSLTGTFGGAIVNAAANRSYPFTFTISAANTWEQKTITVAGDTTGTWETTNSTGLYLTFGLGVGSTFSGTAGAWAATNYASATGATSVVGTNGATFYITGVQLEKGSTATSFDYRPYGTELALCQRYLPAFISTGASTFVGGGYSVSSTGGLANYVFKTTTRTPPTGVTVSAASDFEVMAGASGGITATALTFAYASTDGVAINTTVASGQTSNAGAFLRGANSSAKLLFTGCEL